MTAVENTTGAKLPAQKAQKLDLEVKAAWHEQLHQSKVTALCCSSDGATLWSGCDAAAPRLTGESNEPPIAAVNAQDGTSVDYAACLPVSNIRLLRPTTDGSGLLCITAQGLVLAWDLQNATLADSLALPGTPSEAATASPPAKPAASAPTTPPACDGTASAGGCQQLGSGAQPAAQAEPEGLSSGSGSAGDASPPMGPEFEAETGYRGHREGYLFRDGSKGRGYYRKDVVRLYCGSAQAQPERAPPEQRDTAGSLHCKAAAADSSAAQASQEDAQSGRSGEEVQRYIQRLVKAPPSMQSIITDPAGQLLFTASVGHKDSSIRVWRLHWGAAPDLLYGSSSSGGANSNGSAGSPARCPRPQLFRTLTGHEGQVLSLALSPDGGLLFSGSYDQTVRVWSTVDWRCLRVLKGHGGGVRGLAVSPDGGMLYSAAADNTIRVWSTQHWVCLRSMHGRHEETTWPACLALSPDGRLLASASTGPMGGSTLKVFQTDSSSGREAGSCLATFAQLGWDQKADMSALLWSSDSSTLYSGASDGTVAAWRVTWRAVKGEGIRKGFL